MRATLDGLIKIHLNVDVGKLTVGGWFSFKYTAGSSAHRRKVQYLHPAVNSTLETILHVREYEGNNAYVSEKRYTAKYRRM